LYNRTRLSVECASVCIKHLKMEAGLNGLEQSLFSVYKRVGT